LRKTNVSRLYFLLGLVNLLVAAFIGVLIRWHFLFPLNHFNYRNWLHAHSHITFLGWIYMGLIALINVYFEKSDLFPHLKFKKLAWWILVTNIGMLIFFPIQGYGPIPIFFSSIHMILGVYIFYLFLPIFKAFKSLGIQLIQWGFIFMIISGIGPLTLGPILTMGLKGSDWYDFAIYFYLHFQYNGFFTLVILGLIVHHLERDRQIFLEKIRNPILYGLLLAIILTYLLSILGSDPPMIFYLLGGLGAVIQVVIVIFILVTILRYYSSFFHGYNLYINALLVVSLTALESKLYLQFLSGIPAIANWVFHSHHTIIAYLHLVLIGFVTSFIIGWWYKFHHYPKKTYFFWGILCFIIGFIGQETVLLLYILNLFKGFEFAYQLLLFLSIFLFMGIAGMFVGFIQKPKPG